MATRFVNIDRNTPMLLPPDLRDWVQADDMVHFVITATETMPLPSLRVNWRGTGSEQYPPRMMLALLIYCYANGIFGSRRIERATYRDVGVRYLAADTHPDHDTICKFRRENFDAVGEAFLNVLQLARELGVLKVGTVSVDGTHIKASASKHKNVRYDRARELEQQLRNDIQQLLEQAEQTDQQDSADGQSLPDEIARRERLLEKMQKAQRDLEERAQQRANAERAAYERKVRDRDERDGKHQGPKIKPPKDTPDDKEQVNLTDADSSLMRKCKGEGYTQSFNSQAVVDADGSQLILGGHVTACASDVNELLPALASVPEELGDVTAVLADAGYASGKVFDELDETSIDAYIATGREGDYAQRTYDYRPESCRKKPRTTTDPRLLAMSKKLKTEAGKRLYAKRKHTVEPVFGIIKEAIGFRQFLLRGLAKVQGEWSLVRLAYNVKRLWKLQLA